VEGVEAAAQRSARTVAITNYVQSPLAKTADLVLETSFEEQRAVASVSSSNIAQICLLDALYFIVGSWRSRGARALAEVAEERVQRLLR
jgi:DNA-binding MurR/RpiR family transcriptional regulator